MEIHAGIQRAIECAWLAGKLEANAVGKDEDTARSLFRAAAKFRAGQHLALADIVSELVGRDRRAHRAAPQ